MIQFLDCHFFLSARAERFREPTITATGGRRRAKNVRLVEAIAS
jgi:hypothetical protein